MTARRVSLYTLGCRLNQAETALIGETFRARGYDVASHGDAVDVAVIHTCSVTDRADSRCRQEIRRVRRKAPDAIVCAVGCYAQSDPAQVAAIDGVDLVVGTDRKYGLASIVETFTRGDEPEVIVDARPDGLRAEYPVAGFYPDQTRANLKIQDGCSFGCAFCLLPRVRGPARSRAFGDVVREAEALAERGHREIVITGVNIGTYADDGRDIVDVLHAVSAVDGVARVRVSSIEPTTIADGVLEWMATSDKACRHLHVPLQSGDDAILAAMRRVYTSADYAAFIERAVARVPGLGLGTDVIVGFPGESEAAYLRTKALLESLPFTYWHVFSFSPRIKTAAARRPDPVDRAEIKRRSVDLRAAGDVVRRAVLANQAGREARVLCETIDDDGLRKGLTGDYVRVGFDPGAAREHDLVRVRLGAVQGDFVRGDVLAGAPA